MTMNSRVVECIWSPRKVQGLRRDQSQLQREQADVDMLRCLKCQPGYESKGRPAKKGRWLVKSRCKQRMKSTFKLNMSKKRISSHPCWSWHETWEAFLRLHKCTFRVGQLLHNPNCCLWGLRCWSFFYKFSRRHDCHGRADGFARCGASTRSFL